jgi:hypothetical protein
VIPPYSRLERRGVRRRTESDNTQAAETSLAPLCAPSVELNLNKDEFRRGLYEALIDGPVTLVELDSVDLGVARKGSEVAPHAFA